MELRIAYWSTFSIKLQLPSNFKLLEKYIFITNVSFQPFDQVVIVNVLPAELFGQAVISWAGSRKNQNAPRPSEHPPGKKMSKRLGGIKGCKYKTSSWHLNRFTDADNIESTV